MSINHILRSMLQHVMFFFFFFILFIYNKIPGNSVTQNTTQQFSHDEVRAKPKEVQNGLTHLCL